MMDYIIGGIMFLLIVIQYISDQQQYDFQTEKYRRIENNEKLDGDYKRGFVTTGLWSFSRHPNFTCEQLIWITFYCLSASANGTYLNWSIVGCILLVILFVNSAIFSEGISSRKYPEYKKYQENVPMFLRDHSILNGNRFLFFIEIVRFNFYSRFFEHLHTSLS